MLNLDNGRAARLPRPATYNPLTAAIAAAKPVGAPEGGPAAGDALTTDARTPRGGTLGNLPWDDDDMGASAYGLSAAESVRLAMLPQKEQFGRLAEALDSWNDPAVAADLGVLLAAGKLTGEDSEGQTVLDRLVGVLDRQPDPQLGEIGAQELVRQIVGDLARPFNIFQGKGTVTCAAASIQSSLACDQPAEYARIATQLLFDGKANLPNAEREMELDPAGLSLDEGRTALGDVMQESLASYARQFDDDGSWIGPTDDPSDLGGGAVGTKRGLGGGAVGAKRGLGGGAVGTKKGLGGGEIGQGDEASASEDAHGLTPGQIAHLYRDVVGRDVINVEVNDEDRAIVADQLRRAVNDGEKPLVGVEAHDDAGNPTRHAVQVIGVTKRPGKPEQVVFTDSQQGTPQSMPLDEFMALARVAMFNAAKLDPRLFDNVASETAFDDFGRFGSERETVYMV